MFVDELLNRLDSVRTSGNGWVARCPCPTHGSDGHDRDPSLSINAGDDGRILLKCFAGCNMEAVVAALDLSWTDLSGTGSGARTPAPILCMSVRDAERGSEHIPTSGDALVWLAEYAAVPREFIETLPLRAVPGAVAYEFAGTTTRKMRKVGEKTFWWEPPGASSPALWPSPTGQLSAEIWITEGESDCIVARHAGYDAYALTKGAQTSLPLEQARLFRERGVRKIHLCLDADAAGREALPTHVEVFGTAGLDVWTCDLAPLVGNDGKDLRDVWRRMDGDGERFRHSLDSIVEPANSFCPPKDEVWAGKKLRVRTAREIASSVAELVRWIAAPWVAAGSLTELSGKIKAAGKTTWLFAMVKRVLDGEPFMGRPTMQTNVVYLTEQTDQSLRAALARAGLVKADGLHLVQFHDTVDMKWIDVVAGAVDVARRVEAGLLIVDTLGQFARLRGDDENTAGAALEAIEPLQYAAGVGLGVIASRHERKSGGNVGEAARGSTAFGGAADIIISLRRPQGGNNRSTVRELQALSRFDETPDTLTIELTDDGYTVIGESPAYAKEEATRVLTEILPHDQEKAASLDEIIKASGLSRSTIQRALEELPEVRYAKSMKRGNPLLYWLPNHPDHTPADLPAQTISLDGQQDERDKDGEP